MRSITAIACSLLGVANASGVFDRAPGGLPKDWSFARHAGEHEPIKLRVAVRQQNVDHFEQIFLDVSTPDHPMYGKHLEGHEIKQMLRPTEVSTNAVMKWLQSNGVQAIDEDGDWISFDTKVGNANKLLNTTFSWYTSDYKGKQRLRTLEYYVPDEIMDHINMVQPTTRFGTLQPQRSTLSKGEIVEPAQKADILMQQVNSDAISASCNTSITPTCLLQLYNVHYGADAKNGNKVAFASFLEEYARYDDLATWEPEFAPWATGQNFTVIPIAGGLNDQIGTEDSGEANLDCQYMKGMSAPTPEFEFSTAGRAPLVPDLDTPTQADNGNEPYLDYLIGLSKLSNSQLPQTISHSYGEDEQGVPEAYVRQVCQMFGQLGARGVSVLFSSGDSGVGSACLSNDGKNTTEFQPQFPAACPTVTSVGGTRYIMPEKATTFSSGGFSRLFPTPQYQFNAVQGYLAQIGNKFAPYFNRNGRGFPDVSAQSYHFLVQDQGVLKAYQGTSCASPTFAGIVSLLNSARISKNLPPLGFLNPFLYSAGIFGLNDITEGGSTGCNGRARFNGPPNGSPVIPYASFNATPGWDPVTGLGTPDFGKLLQLTTPGTQNTGGPVA